MPPADNGIDSSCTGQDVSACHRPDAIGSLHDSLSVSHLTNNPAWNCCGWRFRYRYKLQLRFRSELRGILTPEQLSEWDELIEELLGQVHLRHAPRMADSH